MGNSCKKCFKFQRTSNKYVRSELSQSRDLSIEFENLMTNDYYDELTVPNKKRNSGAPFTVASYMQWLSDQEKAFMEDDDDDHKEIDYPLSNTSSSSYTQQNKIRINGSHVPLQANKSISNNMQQNWCTFEDKNDVANEGHLTNDQLTGYFLDELSRDITLTHDLVDPNEPVLYEEEEIDGPELARLIRRMRPRDLFLTGGNGDLLTSAHSTILIGNSSSLMDKDSNIVNLYTKIHQNLMKGLRDIHSVATSERDHSSVDLDWDHEPGMNPSLALVHKRTDTEEDLIMRLKSEDNKDPETSTLKNQSDLCKTPHVNPVDLNHVKTDKKQLTISSIKCDNYQSPTTISPMDCTDEMVWDMEEDIYSANPNQYLNLDASHPVYLSDYCSSNSVVCSDKCHLLSE